MKSRKVFGLFAICISLLGLQVAINGAAAATGTVMGTVFNDKNSNGANDGTDAGVSGVAVSAYDSSGTQVGTATTSGNGTYSLNVSSAATNSVRIEFTTPNGYQPSFQGAANATSIQFVSIPATNVNYAVHQPGQFCANNNADPLVASNCIRPGTSAGTAATSATLTSVRWSQRSSANTNMLTHSQTGTTWGIAQDPGSGLVWSSAVLRRHSGLGPRGLGGIYVTTTSGTSLIASFDVSTLQDQGGNPILVSANSSLYSDVARGLSSSSPLSLDTPGYEGAGSVGLGDIDFTPDGYLWVTNLYEKTVLRIKIEGTPSAPTLGAVTEYVVPQNSATTCTTGGGVTSNTARPWGLEYDASTGQMLVGVVCAKESNPVSLTSASGEGVIISLNTAGAGSWSRQTTVAFDRQRVIEGKCDWVKDFSGNNCKLVNWKSWSNDYAAIDALNSGNNESYPQPILSDIEILEDGSLVVGIIDRFNYQMGSDNISPYDSSQAQPLKTGWTSGDTQLLCKTGSATWVQEASTPGYDPSGSPTTQKGGCVGITTAGGKVYESSGWAFARGYDIGGGNQIMLIPEKQQPSNNGSVEFFNDAVCNARIGTQILDGTSWNLVFCADQFLVPHLEPSLGGIAVWPPSGNQELVSSAMDANNTLFTGGIRWYSMTDGDSRWGKTMSSGNSSSSFEKAASMGDVEILCDQAPVQIGNRVWIDTNGNGIQDPEETPVAGVTVRLYDTAGTTLLGTAMTNAQGQYYFSSNLTEAAAGNGDHLGGGLTAGQPYKIRLDKPEDYASGGPLLGYQLTQATATSPATSLDTSVDSNATIVNSYPEAGVSMVLAGVNNHTYDFGFIRPKVSVGNFVWIDSDADGIQDQGEPGLAGAVLTLTDMSNNSVTNVLGQVVGSQTTASNGAYLFENLPPGQYKVNITYPAGYQATTASAGSNRAVDSSTDTATSVNLPNNEDADVTLDFGVVVTPAPAPLVNPTTTTTTTTLPVQVRNVIKVSVGDFVWLDTDRDGVQDANEKGIAGVSLSIRNADGSLVYDINGKLVSSTKTNKSGRYSFDNLPPGQYRVTVVDPAGYTATLAKSVSDAAVDSSLRSELSIVLSTDGQRDLSLDFGFYRPSSSERVEVGNYVWKDRNGNGLQGPGDTGIRGAILSITDSDGLPVRDVFNRLVRPQTTKNDGKYLFRNLPPGKYVVRIKYPDNYFPTTRDKKNRGLNSSTIKATSRNLKGGERDLTLDFGVVYRSGISGLPETR